MKKVVRVLFVCKKGSAYGFDRKHSGLWNSTKFVSDAVGDHPQITSKIVQVVDNNCIDREVHQYKPDIVVIEALFVIPEKFDVLKRLHPRVKWYVHLHSDVPFLSGEGIAMEWIPRYLVNDVGVISNSKELVKAIRYAVSPFGEVVYCPNVYPAKFGTRKDRSNFLDVGCFGAIRPLKNQLIQLMAAIKYSRLICKELRFHINSNRIEGGASVMKNLRRLAQDSGVELVEHEWSNHHDFISTVKRMDVMMQVSYSETFCIVAADAISSGVPVIASPEIEWLAPGSKVDPNLIDEIVKGLHKAVESNLLLRYNQARLWVFAKKARKLWIDFLLSEPKEPMLELKGC